MKYHRVFAKINLDAIGENMSRVRAKIPAGVKIMAVVKADAYGHGAVSVAQYLEATNSADFFGVAAVEEALELRGNGIESPILILGYTSPGDFHAAVKNGISMAIFTLSDARLLSHTAMSEGTKAKVHIKVDTGMSRIGFPVTDEAIAQVAEISKLPGIEIEGVFSHYATADEDDKTEALHQRKLFDAFVQEARRRGVSFPVRHLSNSAGTVELDSYYEMVRCGIIMYGLSPNGKELRNFPLSPAMELCSKITHIKEFEPGQGISYGHTFVTDRRTLCATVSVGYADGYPRALSGKGFVLAGGKRCPILGRVCMDQLMIDITDAPGVKVGDDVILVGRDKNEFIPAEEVAEAAGSFNYEFVCGVSRRVPRIYIKNGIEYKTVTYIEI